jgi:hypothetical protein
VLQPLPTTEDLGDKARDVFVGRSLSVGRLVKEFIDLVSGLSSELWHNVGIGVHGQADLRVAQDLRDDARRDSLSQEQDRASMSEVLKTALGESGAVQVAVEFFAYFCRVNRLAGRGRKHQIRLNPFVAHRRLLELLAIPVLLGATRPRG